MEEIILNKITKIYNNKCVLNKIDHTFIQGESIAFIGHNGCGKSTLLKIIAGLVKPSFGTVQFKTPPLFHYVPEKFVPSPLTSRVYLTRMGELDGLNTKDIVNKINLLSEDFFLSEMLDIPMNSLSKGTLQKIGVIQALLKEPSILLLDEPLSGQDKESQKVFINKMNELRERKVTILMSCHETKLINAISDQVFTIKDSSLTTYKPNFEKTYTLIFENKNSRPLLDKMTKYGTGYKIQVSENESHRIIIALLNDGWEMKGMYDNENY